MSRRLRAILLVVTLTLVVAAQLVALRLAPRRVRLRYDPQEVNEVRFVTLDGERRPPQVGDVVSVDGTWLFLRERGDWTVQRHRPRPGWTSLERGGDSRLVHVTVTEENTGDFLKLSNEQLGRLWGLELRECTAEIATRLARLDLDQTCVTLSRSAAARDVELVPERLRYLVLCHSGRGVARFTPTLRFLALEENTFGAGFDELSSPELRALVVGKRESWYRVKKAVLPELRNLEMRKGGNPAELLPRSQKLRRFVFREGSLSDLPVLATLPELQVLDLEGSAVTRLPATGLQKLEEVNLRRTRVSDRDVAAFKTLHPRAHVETTAASLLADAFGCATHVVARDPGRSRNRLFEVAAPDELREIAARISVHHEDSWDAGVELGARLELWEEDELTLTVAVTLHDDGRVGLGWIDGSRGEAILTPDSARWLLAWLEQHGVKGQPFSTTIPQRFTDIAFSSSADRVAAVARDGVLRLWQTEELLAGNARPFRELVAPVTSSTAHGSYPHPNARYPISLVAVAFSGDGTEVAARDLCNEIVVWSLATGQVMRRLSSDQASGIDARAFPSEEPSPQHYKLIRENLEVAVLDMRTGDIAWSLAYEEADPRTRRAWIIGTRTLVLYEGGLGRIQFRDAASGSHERTVKLTTRPSPLQAVSPDGRFLALGDGDDVRLVDLGKR